MAPIVPGQSPQRSLQTTSSRVGDTGAGAIAAGARQLGAGVQAIGSVLGDAAVDMQQRKDQRDALRAATQFSRSLTDLMQAPETGVLNRRGELAEGSTEGVALEIDKIVDGLKKDLGPRAAEAFDKIVFSDINGAYQTAAKHESEQLRVADVETRKGYAAVTKLKLQSNIDAPLSVFEDDLSQYQALVQSAAEAEGVPKAIAELQGESAVMEVLATRIQNAVASARPEVAAEMLQRYGDALPDVTRRALRKQVDDYYVTSIALSSARAVVRIGAADSATVAREQAVKLAKQHAAAVEVNLSPDHLRQVEDVAVEEFNFSIKDEEGKRSRAAGQHLSGLRSLVQAYNVGNPDANLDVIRTYYHTARSQLTSGLTDTELKAFDALYENFRNQPAHRGHAEVTDPDVSFQVNTYSQTDWQALDDLAVERLVPFTTPAFYEENVREPWLAARNATNASVTKVGTLTKPEVAKRLLPELQAGRFIGAGKSIDKLNRDERLKFNEFFDQVVVEMGEDLSPESYRRAVAEVMYADRIAHRGFFADSVVSVGELLKDPFAAKRTPYWETLQEMLTPAQLEDANQVRGALQEIFARETRDRRGEIDLR